VMIPSFPELGHFQRISPSRHQRSFLTPKKTPFLVNFVLKSKISQLSSLLVPQEAADKPVGGCRLVLERCWAWNSAGAPNVLRFLWFSSAPPGKFGYSTSSKPRYLSNPFQFIVHRPFYPSTLYSLNINSVRN
jgi:hypothetical protein